MYLFILTDRVTLMVDPLYLPKVASLFHRAQEITLLSFCDNPKNDNGNRFRCEEMPPHLLAESQRV